jgi:hypothetical protein
MAEQSNLTAFFKTKSTNSRVTVSLSTADADKRSHPTESKMIHPIQKYIWSLTESHALPRVERKGQLFLHQKLL